MTKPDWSALSHAYGAADDLPEILKQLSPDQHAPAWDELWGRVCHQGTTYSASPYVLPVLLQVAQSWSAVARTMPLTLAGDIIASPEFRIRGFEEVVKDLGVLAFGTASEPDLSRSDRIYIMGSAMIFAGDTEWGLEISHLHDQEFIGRCPSCKSELYLIIGDEGYFASNVDPVLKKDGSRERIVPCEPGSLSDNRAWLWRTASSAGDEELATRICCVFGKSRCPACESTFQVAETVEHFQRS